MVIVIVLNICRDDLIHGRWVKICVCCPVISTLLSSAVLGWGVGLCASVVVCVQISLCWWESEGVRSCSSMMGAGPSSESGLGLGDVDFDAVGAFCGGVLSYWCRSLGCHQSFPGLLPLLVHSRVHAPVLSCRKPWLWRLLWHGWWKLLVFVLRIREKCFNNMWCYNWVNVWCTPPYYTNRDYYIKYLKWNHCSTYGQQLYTKMEVNICNVSSKNKSIKHRFEIKQMRADKVKNKDE